MANKNTNLTALEKVLKTSSDIKEFAGILINNDILDKPSLKATDVDDKSDAFKDFLACTFSDKDAEKKDAVVLGKFHFLKKSKAKSDIEAFADSLTNLVVEIKTHAVQNKDDKASAKKSKFFCGVLESLGQKVEPLQQEPLQQEPLQQESLGTEELINTFSGLLDKIPKLDEDFGLNDLTEVEASFDEISKIL